MKSAIFSLFIAIISVLSVHGTAEAHPGRTASDGCHYCRTNCASWGEVAGARHCHGGGTTTNYSPPKQPSCPANSYKSGSSCYCNTGYALFQNSCHKVPTNAHAVESTSAAWECNTGYKEVGNSCVKIEQPKLEPKVSEPLVVDPEPEQDTQEVFTPAPTPPVQAENNSSDALPEPEEEGGAFGFIGIAGVGGGAYYLYNRGKKKLTS